MRNTAFAISVLAIAMSGCAQSSSNPGSTTSAAPSHVNLPAVRRSWGIIRDGVALARRKVNNAYDDIAKGDDIAPQEAGLDLEFGSRWIQCAYNEVDKLPDDYRHKGELKSNIKDFWDSMVAIHDITDDRDRAVVDYAGAVAKAKSFDSDWSRASANMKTYYRQHGGQAGAILTVGSRVAELAQGGANDPDECPS